MADLAISLGKRTMFYLLEEARLFSNMWFMTAETVSDLGNRFNMFFQEPVRIT